MNPSTTISNVLRQTLLGLLLVLGSGSLTALQAQGWEQFIGGNDFDEFFDIIQSKDLGYIATGYSDGKFLSVYRLDPEGNIIWSREDLNSNPGVHQGHALIETSDGSIVVVGYCNACVGGGIDIYVIKLDAYGNLLWNQGFGGPTNDEAWDIIEDHNGDLVITGSYRQASNDDVFLLKLNSADGSILMDRKYDGTNNRDDRGFAITLSNDNNYIVTGSTSFSSDITFIYLLKISATTGDTLWTRELGSGKESVGLDIIESVDFNGDPEGYAIAGYTISTTSDIFLVKTDLNGNQITAVNYGNVGVDRGWAILQTSDRGYLIAGSDGLNDLVELPTLVKTDNSGTRTWSKTYGNDNMTLISARAEAIVPTSDGGFIIAGSRSQGSFIPDPSDAFVIKLNANADYYTNQIQGRVFFDFNGNCQLDGNEFGLENWVIATTGDLNLYQTSGSDGSYSFPVDSGDFTVSLVAPSDYWRACTPSYTISLNNYDSTTLNFPIQVETQCAYLEVDAAAPFLVPCTNSEYYVSYCNYGTISAANAYIEVEMDPSLILIDATESFSFLGGNRYRFDIGTVAVTQCDSFRVTVRVDCNSVEGQTHCFEAHIFPDTLCVPMGNWDGSSVAVKAECDGADVVFSVTNEGTEDMSEPLSYIIVEDQLMLRPAGPIQLEVGKDSIIRRTANGATYRIIMDQSKDHPGKSMPTAAIEGCVDGGGSFSTGYYTSFAENDADNFIVRDCRENIPSTTVPTNAKRGYPKGYGDDRLITPETELKYVINFENIGQDTAIRMVIRDTLSSFLDPATVRPGASSHDYSFEVTGEGILKFTFENISLLPGSSARSRGFVKYTVSQKPDNAPGTQIKNGAAIFFDFGSPQQTEITCHKIEDFIRVATQEIFHPDVQAVKVFPNPFLESATVEIIGDKPFGAGSFSLFDAGGKLVYRQFHSGSTFTINRNQLPAGFYFYRLEADARLISTGKVIIQ